MFEDVYQNWINKRQNAIKKCGSDTVLIAKELHPYNINRGRGDFIVLYKKAIKRATEIKDNKCSKGCPKGYHNGECGGCLLIDTLVELEMYKLNEGEKL